MTDTSATQKGAGLAIAALILGIVAAVTGLIPLVGFFLVWVPAILAIVFGIIGVTGGRPKRGIALAGGILGVASIVISLVTFIAGIGAAASAGSQAVEQALDAASSEAALTEESASSEVSGGSTVVYEVTGDGTATSISYSTYDNGSFGSQSANGAALPWSSTQTIADTGSVFDLSALTVTAMGSAETTTLTCKISVNGEVVSEKTSTGSFAMVICSKVQ